MPAGEQALAAVFSTLRRLAMERPLFAVLDAARDERVPAVLESLRVPHRSLYHGPQGEALADVAPYVADLSQSPEAARRLLLEGWGDARGVFLSATGTLVALRRHLRRLLMAEVGDPPERALFRFYDPRVFRALYPVCTDWQKHVLFGEAIQCYLVEDEAGFPLVFQREHEGVPQGYHRKTVALRFTQEQADSTLQGRALLEFLAGHLRDTVPSLVRGLPPDALEEFVALALARAQGHGLSRPADLAVFTVLMFEVAPNFDDHPAIRTRIGEGLGEALSKVDEQVWVECAERYDASVWTPASPGLQAGRRKAWTG